VQEEDEKRAQYFASVYATSGKPPTEEELLAQISNPHDRELAVQYAHQLEEWVRWKLRKLTRAQLPMETPWLLGVALELFLSMESLISGPGYKGGTRWFRPLEFPQDPAVYRFIGKRLRNIWPLSWSERIGSFHQHFSPITNALYNGVDNLLSSFPRLLAFTQSNSVYERLVALWGMGVSDSDTTTGTPWLCMIRRSCSMR